MLRGTVTLLSIACILVSACSSGKDDDDPRTVPEGIKPEDAFFAFKQRNSGATSRKVLLIRMSTAKICERTAVPSGTEWVDIEVVVPPASDIPVATYGVGFDGESGLTLQTSSSTQCNSYQGLGAGRGSITIQEIDATHVKGSFAGTNADTRLDLKGTFLAKPCPNELNACL